MLTLYLKPGCPYCATVTRYMDEHHLARTERSVFDPEVLEELIARGGKRQVPFLVDPTRGTHLYESDDIVEYLAKHYVQS